MAYARRILLIAMGTTPHLLTVTLAALFKKAPAAMPTEIHVITTQKGADCVRREFIENPEGLLGRFYADYGLPFVGIAAENLHVMTGADNEGLDDIRTPEESARAADFIVDLVRSLTSDSESSLTVSIIGGRKSMSLLLGSAMMFFGRDQDAVSHVLSKDESPASACAYPALQVLRQDPDVVNLGEIPFLRLRPILPSALLTSRYSYSEIVEASQEQLSHPVRAVVRRTGDKWRLFVDGVEVKPEKRNLGLYLWLALRHKLGRQTPTSFGLVTLETFFLLRVQFIKVLERVLSEKSWQSACELYLGLTESRLHELLKLAARQEIANEAELYRWVQKQLTDEELEAVNRASGDFSKKISSNRTKFNDALKEALKDAVPDVTERRIGRCCIDSTGDKDGAVYSLGLMPADISLPQELLAVLSGATSHPAQHWKTV